jgi:hypothetical protein
MGAFFDTLLDRWPPPIAALSIPTRCQVLAKEDLRALLSQHPETRALIGCDSRLRFSEPLSRWIDETVATFPGGTFARLGVCSFVTAERGPKRICTGEQVVKLMMHPGVRAASLAYRCFRANQPVALCIREWRDIAARSEFRIFIKGGNVLGISQYHWRCTFPEIQERVETIIDLAKQAFVRIAAALHIQSVIADIFIFGLDEDPSWVLAELNPYWTTSSSCLFTWNDGGDLDGTFRYRAANGDIRIATL